MNVDERTKKGLFACGIHTVEIHTHTHTNTHDSVKWYESGGTIQDKTMDVSYVEMEVEWE